MHPNDNSKQSVDPTRESGQSADTGNLTKHQQAIIDYAMVASQAANKVTTEEIVTRTRHSVHTEIQAAFETHNRLTTGRKLIMTAGAAVAFGLGWLASGWLGRNKPNEDVANGVHD